MKKIWVLLSVLVYFISMFAQADSFKIINHTDYSFPFVQVYSVGDDQPQDVGPLEAHQILKFNIHNSNNFAIRLSGDDTFGIFRDASNPLPYCNYPFWVKCQSNFEGNVMTLTPVSK